MKISIVTISFNQALYLRQCIDSVLSQGYKNVEYIIVDPGSTDGSREIIDSYGDQIIKIFKPDKGPADGLNNGFSYATGEIFGYLNSDDMLTTNALSNVVSHFRTPCPPDVIYGHGYIINETGHLLRKCYSDKFTLTAAAYGSSVVIQPSTFFMAKAFKAVNGFNPHNKSNWDGELFIDMAMHGFKLRHVKDFLSNYRVHSEGITGSGKLQNLHREHNLRMFEKIMGRNRKPLDRWVSYAYRLRKHLIHPAATLERLRFGPIFGTRD